MRLVKKLVCVLLAAFMAVGLFSLYGCGGNDDDPNTLTIGVANNTSEINIINTFRTAYMRENPGTTIEIVRITGSYDNSLVRLINSDDLPDIVQVYDFSAQYWTDAGLYVPISDYMQRDGISEGSYFKSVVAMAKSGTDDQMYWAPRDYNKVVVVINTAIFDAAGLEPPADDWTWTDFVNTCKALNEKKSDILRATGQQVFYPVDMNLNWEAVYYPAMRSFGGDLYDVAANGDVSALENLDGIKQGLDTLLALADDGLAVEPTQTGSPFPSKQCAMMFTVRPNITSYAGSLTDAEGNATIDFVSMPAFEGVENSYIGMGCTGYAISKQCAEDKRDLAWDFLKFVMTEDGQNAFCESGAGVPVLVSMANDTEASWRQYLPEANHDAFIQYDTRDLPMTEYLNGIDPSKHIAVRTVLTDNMTKNLFSAGDRSSYYSQLSEMLMNALR